MVDTKNKISGITDVADVCDDEVITAIAQLHKNSREAVGLGFEGFYNGLDTEGWRMKIGSDDNTVRALFNEDGGVLAFARLGLKEGTNDIAELHDLCVDPQNFQEGVRMRLFHDAVEISRTRGFKTLHIEVGNEGEEAFTYFCEQQGCKEIPGGVEIDEDDQVLTRWLEYDLN